MSVTRCRRDDRKILKIRQLSRDKKKASPFAKKNICAAQEPHFANPKSGVGGKHNYFVSSSHRRAVSQPLGREEDWSGEDDGYGGVGRSSRSQGSGVGLFMGDNMESVPDTQVRVENKQSSFEDACDQEGVWNSKGSGCIFL